MNPRSMSRSATMGVVAALSVAAIVGPAVAQAQQPAPPYGTAPSTAPKPTSPSMSPVEKARPAQVEGTVKKVDPGAQTVDISSGLFGMMGRRLEVSEQTTIQMGGRQATLADIREGVHLRALGRQDPLDEFHREAIPAFREFMATAEDRTVATFDEAEITGPDWTPDEIGLSRPSATWTYMVHDNPFGSEIERFFANAARALLGRR